MTCPSSVTISVVLNFPLPVLSYPPKMMKAVGREMNKLPEEVRGLVHANLWEKISAMTNLGGKKTKQQEPKAKASVKKVAAPAPSQPEQEP